MLYPTLNQPLVILMTTLAGLFCGVFFDLARILNLLLGKNKYTKHIIEFFATIVACGVLFLTNLKFNYGQFRFYVVLIFLITFALERIITGILWTKLLKRWYSSITQRRKGSGQREKEQTD